MDVQSISKLYCLILLRSGSKTMPISVLKFMVKQTSIKTGAHVQFSPGTGELKPLWNSIKYLNNAVRKRVQGNLFGSGTSQHDYNSLPGKYINRNYSQCLLQKNTTANVQASYQ